MICRQITVKGKVQGVFFRATARDVAYSLGLAGEVKNLYNGDVWITVEGPAEKIEEFISWCHQGPPNAEVEEVIIEDVPVRGYRGFNVNKW